MRTYIHALSGFLLTLGICVHVAVHRRGLKATVNPKIRGRAAAGRAVYGCLTFLALLAFLSGFREIASPAVSVLHHATGFLALIGLTAHTIARLAVRGKALSLRLLKRSRTGFAVQRPWAGQRQAGACCRAKCRMDIAYLQLLSVFGDSQSVIISAKRSDVPRVVAFVDGLRRILERPSQPAEGGVASDHFAGV
jgi:hypothetical protein